MELSKTFGNKKGFSIECKIEEVKKHTSFGFICVWLDELFIGELEQYCMLSIPFDSFFRSLKYTGQRKGDLFLNKSKEAVLEIIKQSIYGNRLENLAHSEAIELTKWFRTFELFVNWGETFDGWYTVLIENDDFERFIWEKSFGEDQYIKEIFLPKGTYQNVVTQFLEWFSLTTKT